MTKAKALQFSIAIVTFQRLKKLEQCLISLKEALDEAESPPAKVLIFINGNDQETRDWLEEQQIFSFSPEIVCSPDPMTPAGARNNLIDRSSGEYLLFVDDDIIFPRDYFKNAFQILADHSGVDVLGGPDGQPEPPTNLTQRIFSLAIESWDVTGPTADRHLSDSSNEVKSGSEMNLILCHLWFRTDLLKEKEYRFDPSLLRNEENELLLRLKEAQRKILYASSLQVGHQRKSSLEGIVKAYWTSGRCRLRCFFKRWEWHHGLYSLPLVVVLAAYASDQWRGVFYLFVIYFFVNFLSSVSTIWKLWEVGDKRVVFPRDILFLMAMKVLVLCAYFSGQLFQLFHFSSWRAAQKVKEHGKTCRRNL